MGFGGNGSSDLAKLRSQFQQLAQEKEQRNAKVAAAITEAMQRRLREGPWPARKDGSPSTIPDLANYVGVTPSGNSFRIRCDHPAAEYLASGTSKMAARPLLDEEELTAAVEQAFSEAVAEVMGGK